MTPKRIIASAIALLASALVASVTGATAPANAQARAPVGDRIDVARGEPTTFLADTPFHVRHGWATCVGSGEGMLANGRLRIELDVDGVERSPSYVEVSMAPEEETGLPCDVISRISTFNFPDGLPPGSHILTGHWIGPCQPLADDAVTGAFCEHPADAVEASFSPRSVTVSFYQPVWNPGVDWRNAPDQANPSPDIHGNPDVWSYLASESLVHDPSSYSLLPSFSDLGGRQQWDAPGYVNLLVGHATGTQAMVMHSYGGRIVGPTYGRSATLGWRSPIDGEIRISGSVRLPDLSVCNVPVMGSIWSIDKGATTLASAVLPPGGGTAFDLTTTVSKDEKLYFVHDPGYDSHCDMLLVTLQIEKA